MASAVYGMLSTVYCSDMVCADPLYRSSALQASQRTLASQASITWLSLLSIEKCTFRLDLQIKTKRQESSCRWEKGRLALTVAFWRLRSGLSSRKAWVCSPAAGNSTSRRRRAVSSHNSLRELADPQNRGLRQPANDRQGRGGFDRLMSVLNAMHRIINFGIVLLLIWAYPLRAANPDDIEFRLRLVKETRVYHMGEPIEMGISYSSQTVMKYYGSFTGPTPESIAVTPHVTPSDGVLDLRELRRDRVVAGDFLGSEGYLDPRPQTEQLDLCGWYRFQRPGHYSVIVTSTEVSRVKSAEEGGGKEHLTLESNPVGLDILPADPAWDAGELSNIGQALNTARNAGERFLPLRRLALLDTPASVQMLVQLYLVNSHGGEDWVFDRGLRDSSQINTIIPLLVAALSDPAVNIPTSLLELLAYLQTRKELGVMPAYPSDPAKQQKSKEVWKARSKVHDNYLAQDCALLMASIERRSGHQRATAIYLAWYYANQRNPTEQLAPEVRSRLEANVLAVANDLDRAQQVQFLTLAWQTMPHEPLLPMIRKLATDSVNDPSGYYSHEAFQLWCKGWPEECNAAILQDVIESNARMDKNVILLMSEAEHPELDEMLESKLKDPMMLQDAFQSQRTAAVVLRAGSRNIASAVDSYLDQITGKTQVRR